MACYSLLEALTSLCRDAHIRRLNYRLMVDGRLAGKGCMCLTRRGYIRVESVSLLIMHRIQGCTLGTAASTTWMLAVCFPPKTPMSERHSTREARCVASQAPQHIAGSERLQGADQHHWLTSTAINLFFASGLKLMRCMAPNLQGALQLVGPVGNPEEAAATEGGRNGGRCTLAHHGTARQSADQWLYFFCCAAVIYRIPAASPWTPQQLMVLNAPPESGFSVHGL